MSQTIPIVCPYCGVGCNLELTLDDKGAPEKGRASGRNQELNQKYLCAKGLVIPEMINHAERLRYPAIRKEGALQRVSWDDALAETAARLKAVVDQYGHESVGLLASSKVLNEEVYLCQKLHRHVIGNNNVDKIHLPEIGHLLELPSQALTFVDHRDNHTIFRSPRVQPTALEIRYLPIRMADLSLFKLVVHDPTI